MKKLFFIAVIASVALAGCFKNDPAPSVNDQNEITFSTPVVALNTKTLIDGVLYPTTENFSVYAWYNAPMADGDGDLYMNNVEVSYNGGADVDTEVEVADAGTWKPNPAYYWPKNGNLDFRAYSPSSLEDYVESLSGTVSCGLTTGLEIMKYRVPDELDDQIDILYSDLAENKSASSVVDGNTYEGVDIKFNHALSAVRFTIAQDAEYPEGTLVVASIGVTGIVNKGDFFQSHADYSNNPGWNVANQDTDPRGQYFFLTATDYAGSTKLTTAANTVGTILVPPQALDKQKIVIEYFIKNNNENPFWQATSIALFVADNQDGTAINDPDDDDDDEDVTVDKWEMGKRYTYNIVFGLDEIYFAPSVEAWDDVTVALPQI